MNLPRKPKPAATPPIMFLTTHSPYGGEDYVPEEAMNSVESAKVLIIGGTSGAGFGVAEALLEHDASIIVSSSSEDRVKNAVKKLEEPCPSAEGRVQGIVCNLGSKDTLESEVAKLFDQVGKDGKLDHIVAGDNLVRGKIEGFSLEQME